MGVIICLILYANKTWKDSSWRLNGAKDWTPAVPSYSKCILAPFCSTIWLVSDINYADSALVDTQGCILTIVHFILVLLLYYTILYPEIWEVGGNSEVFIIIIIIMPSNGDQSYCMYCCNSIQGVLPSVNTRCHSCITGNLKFQRPLSALSPSSPHQ